MVFAIGQHRAPMDLGLSPFHWPTWVGPAVQPGPFVDPRRQEAWAGGDTLIDTLGRRRPNSVAHVYPVVAEMVENRWPPRAKGRRRKARPLAIMDVARLRLI